MQILKGRMNGVIGWWRNKKGFQKISIAIIVDLLILIAFFLIDKLIFLYYLLLNILIFFDIIPLYYYIMLNKQAISPREYYSMTIEKNYMHLDDNLLVKIFEIRINNMRQFLFAYLVLIVTFTLTITFNSEAHNYFKELIFGINSYKIFTAIGTIGIFILVYYTFGLDRFTLKELELLFKSKEKLKQLKEHNIPQMQENSNCAPLNTTQTIKSSEEENPNPPSKDILLKCLEIEWQDHFETRKQTWRSLEIEAVLAAALVGIDWKLDNVFATSAVSILLIISALFGSLITIHHRNKVEIMKFSHIIDIEKKLGMLEPDLFGDVQKPGRIKWLDAISFKSNTSLFILRMHIILLIFGIIYIIFRWIKYLDI